MDLENKLQSEENTSYEINNQTSSNNMIINTIQDLLNSKSQPINMNKYYDNVNKIIVKKDLNPIINEKNSKNNQTYQIKKIDNTKNFPKTSPYTFKYFYSTSRRKALYNSSSDSNLLKKRKNNFESNFINLSKDANIYTANADYIKNKKMLLFDKTCYNENNDKLDKENIFDKTNLKKIRNKKNTLYKTTIFRGGKLLFDKNVETNRKLNIKGNIGINQYFGKKKNKKDKNKLSKKLKDLPINSMIDLIEQNKDNLFPRLNRKIIIDPQSEERIKFKQYNSLYKELMSKKDEIFDNLINNFNKKDDNSNNSKIIISNRLSNLNVNSNRSNISPQNNSIESNPMLENSSIIKFNNSSKNISNLSGYSNLLSKKGKDGLPLFFPVVYSTFVKTNSISQNSRYEKIMESFIKLKTLIENDKINGKENEYDYIKEFLISKQINKKYINLQNIINFSNFLKTETMPIDLNKSLKDNILLALNYNPYNNNNNSKNTKINTKNKSLLHSSSSCSNFKNNLLLGHGINSIKYKFIGKNKDRNSNNKNNYKSLVLDMPKKKKLFQKEENKNNNKLKDELKEEINKEENEIQNKQEKINLIEKNLNLIPFYNNYYNNIKNKNNKKEINPIELKLICIREINKSKMLNNLKKDKKINTNMPNSNSNSNSNLFDTNERLYYTWYRDKNKGDIKNFIKKTKLTEFIMYNKTKEKMFYDKFDEYNGNNNKK